MLIILFSICLVIFLICGIIYFRNEPDPAYFNTDALFDTPKFFNYYDSPYQIKDPTMFISTLETLRKKTFK